MQLKRNLAKLSKNARPRLIEGYILPGEEGGWITVILEDHFYVRISRSDVIAETPESQGQQGFFIEPGSEIWTCKLEPLRSMGFDKLVRVDEENVPHPEFDKRGKPFDLDFKKPQSLLDSGKTIEGAAKKYKDECKGGGSFANNCAHYLSNAFISAGFSELITNLDCVEVRCNQADTCDLGKKLNHRIIRAKNLRCWFATKSTEKLSKIPRNMGFWAVYQERAADGQGHVAIYDSGTKKHYGTGWFPNWEKQEFYKW